MITEDEKARIRAEEVFRAEIRSELTTAGARKRISARAWQFLNSAFGLWLLSALILTGFGGTFARWQRKESERQARLEYRDKLTTEIDCRVLSPIVRHGWDPKSLPGMILLAPGRDSGCLSEFSEENLASLYDRLARTFIEPESGKAEALAAAKDAQLFHARWVSTPLSSRDDTILFFAELSKLGAWRPSASSIIISDAKDIIGELGGV